jgi:hypothetical protein
MKLTKRRSSPYLPVPSTLWTPDSHPPSPAPQSSTNTAPLESRSPTSFIPKIKATRIPFRRRGQSAGPELLRNGNKNIGTDYDYAVEAQTVTQTQTQSGGNKTCMRMTIITDGLYILVPSLL